MSTSTTLEEEILAHLRVKVKAVRSKMLAENKALEDLKRAVSDLKTKIKVKEESLRERMLELKNINKNENNEIHKRKMTVLRMTDGILKTWKDRYVGMEQKLKGIEKDVLISAVTQVFKSEVEFWKFTLQEWTVSVDRWKNYFAGLQKEQDDFVRASFVKIPPGSSPVHTDVWICDDNCTKHRHAKEQFYNF